jgi:uncharacterized membrane protein YphA (DoxX/SURF4 family)
MGVLRFILSLYFAAMLGVAGLAKMEQPDLFAAILRRQRLLPAWGIGAVTRLFPWCEIVLASALVAGIAPRFVAVLLFALFAALTVMQAYLLSARRAAPCMCYGAWSTRNMAGASATTTTLLACFAGLHLGLVFHGAALAAPWRVLASALFVGFEGWIGWRTWQRHQQPRRARYSARVINEH